MKLHFVLAVSTSALWKTTPVQASTPFLKEIVQGRCYERPPTGDDSVDACPRLVGGLMGVLESHLDSDITADKFGSYLESADVSAPVDKALLYLSFNQGIPPTSLANDDDDERGNNEEGLIWKMNPALIRSIGLVTLEHTPGGALMKDLVFCGVDQAENCSVEQSNAYWTFWGALYAKFAANIQGDLQVLVQPQADVEFWTRSVISNLVVEQITSVTIYGTDCSSPTMHKLTSAFESAGFSSSAVTCQEDLVTFILCSANAKSPECTTYENKCLVESLATPVENDDDQQDDVKGGELGDDEDEKDEDADKKAGNLDPPHHQRRHHYILTILVIAGLIVGYKRYLYDGHQQTGYEKVQDVRGDNQEGVPRYQDPEAEVEHQHVVIQ